MLLISQLSMEIFQNSNLMLALWSARNNVITADIENVDQSQHLQKPLYLTYYTTDFKRTFTKIVAMWLLNVSYFESKLPSSISDNRTYSEGNIA